MQAGLAYVQNNLIIILFSNLNLRKEKNNTYTSLQLTWKMLLKNVKKFDTTIFNAISFRNTMTS